MDTSKLENLVAYSKIPLSLDHPYFTDNDFCDRLDDVYADATPYEQEILNAAEAIFWLNVAKGDLNGAYCALLKRVEASGRTVGEDGLSPWSSGDKLGPDTLEQAIDFALSFEIEDKRLPQLIEDMRLLRLIHALENPDPWEQEQCETVDW